jgi:hypothetical protein
MGALAERTSKFDELLTALSGLTPQQIRTALNYMRSVARVTLNERTGTYQITDSGRAWLAAGRAPQEQASEASSGEHAAPTTHDELPAARPTTASFPRTSASPLRYAVFNDGAFFIAKDGSEITCTTDEFRDLLRYLDRMCDEQAAA